MTRTSLLLGALLAVGAAADARERRFAPALSGAVAVRFDRPEHWRCDADGACLRCASLRASAGLTIESPGSPPKHVDVPARGAIRICPP